jgi:hypothetical protein
MPSDPDSSLLARETILRQLGEAMKTLEWAVSLAPEGWSHRSPYGRLSREEGAWSVAMNLAHLRLYEERLPTTVLESLLSGGDGVSDSWFKEPSPYEQAATELAAMPVRDILTRLRAVHEESVELAHRFPEAAWAAPSTEAWGNMGLGPTRWSPARVLSKSLQHTWEHGNAILKVAFFAPRELLE